MATRTQARAVAEDVAACCSPLTGGEIGPESAQRLAGIFKALGDPTRVRLVSLIAATDSGEACICDLTDPVGLSQPTVSHHMRILADAGLVTREQRGRWAYYAVVDEALGALGSALAAGPRRTSPRRKGEGGRQEHR
ncbi:MAG TPA: metalloregulator ArsR/SmtB family transcription factor [Mycobacteriales bacterium]